MKHWTEDDFKQWLYGLKSQDSHCDECPECRAEMARLEAERRRITAQPEVSDEFLAAQRRNIYRRIADPQRRWVPMKWAVSAATVLVVALGLMVPRWRNSPPAISDEQLFADLASIEQSAEPRAIQPIHKLFEE